MKGNGNGNGDKERKIKEHEQELERKKGSTWGQGGTGIEKKDLGSIFFFFSANFSGLTNLCNQARTQI